MEIGGFSREPITVTREDDGTQQRFDIAALRQQ